MTTIRKNLGILVLLQLISLFGVKAVADSGEIFFFAQHTLTDDGVTNLQPVRYDLQSGLYKDARTGRLLLGVGKNDSRIIGATTVGQEIEDVAAFGDHKRPTIHNVVGRAYDKQFLILEKDGNFSAVRRMRGGMIYVMTSLAALSVTAAAAVASESNNVNTTSDLEMQPVEVNQ